MQTLKHTCMSVLVCIRFISDEVRNIDGHRKQGRVLRSTEVQWLSARICPVKRDGSGWFINPPPSWMADSDRTNGR